MTQYFNSDGLRMAFVDEGEGLPVLLIHGFASSITANWIAPGWFKTLLAAGRRVIAIDNRGHGDSEKLYEKSDYGAPAMGEDSLRLIDHLGINEIDVMGYSMGARISAFLTINHPSRVRSVAFGGYGDAIIKGGPTPDPIVSALLARSADDVIDSKARAFRVFAERTGSDLKALAACMASPREPVPPEKLSQLDKPVFIAAGENDDIAGSPEALASILQRPDLLIMPRKDHMTAVGDRAYKQRYVEFLEAV